MRLIDADKLLQQIKVDYNLDYGETLIDPRDFADAVCNAPTVDAVPVIRCRECVYYGYDVYSEGVCNLSEGLPFPEDDSYCSFGLRQKEGIDDG